MKRIVTLLLFLSLCFSLSMFAAEGKTAEKQIIADTVGINAKIYTVNPKQPWAEAIALDGTDIVYVGDKKGARAFIGPKTTVGDMQGRFIMPGIISTHEHQLMVMALQSGLTLENTGDAKKMLAGVKEYVEKNPDAPMFSFGGSYEGRVEIYRQDIDKIILNVRISAAVIAQRESMLDHAFEMLAKYAPKHKSEFFKVKTFKVHGDETPDGHTVGLLEPYADRPDYTGITSFTPEVQTEACLKAAAKGYDIHTHVAGDRTMRQTLDAYEAVRKAGHGELRLGLARITVGKTNLDWEEARRISLLKNRSDKYPLKPHVQEYLRRNDSLILIDVTNAEAASAGNGHAYFRKSPWVSSDILISL